MDQKSSCNTSGFLFHTGKDCYLVLFFYRKTDLGCILVLKIMHFFTFLGWVFPAEDVYLSCCCVSMASEGPSWADQWGTGGIGAMEENDSTKAKKESGVNKKGEGKAGLTKAKAAALAGAQKIKTGTSSGFKWIKNQCQKKNTSK